MKEGSSRRTTLSLWKVQKLGRKDNAPKSKILLADVIATRKMDFRRTHLRSTSLNGLKDGLIRAQSTVGKFHIGNLWACGGHLAAAPFKNFPIRGCCTRVPWDLVERTESRAATCLHRVAGFSFFSRPS